MHRPEVPVVCSGTSAAEEATVNIQEPTVADNNPQTVNTMGEAIIRGIPPEIMAGDIKEALGQFGLVVEVDFKRSLRLCKTYAFITFAEWKGVEKAVSVSEVKIKGYSLKVESLAAELLGSRHHPVDNSSQRRGRRRERGRYRCRETSGSSRSSRHDKRTRQQKGISPDVSRKLP